MIKSLYLKAKKRNFWNNANLQNSGDKNTNLNFS